MVKRKGKRVKRRTIQLPIDENDRDVEDFLAYQSNIGKSIKTLILLAVNQMGNVDVRDYLLNQQIRGKNPFSSNNGSDTPIPSQVENLNTNKEEVKQAKPKRLEKRVNTLDKKKKHQSNKSTSGTLKDAIKKKKDEAQQNNFKDIWNDTDSGLL